MPDTRDHEAEEDAGSPLALLAASLAREAGGQGGGLCVAAAHLAARHLRFDAADPHWPDRDRLAAEPALSGLAAAFERLAGTAGLCVPWHPAVGAGVGLALAERRLAARFGRSLVDHRSWVLCTAATLMTGPVQEAAWLAGAWRLGRLTVFAEAPDGEPAGLACFAASGWAVRRAMAADMRDVGAALSAALRSAKPTLIVCIGPPPARAAAGAHEAAAWAASGSRLAAGRRGWLKRLARHASRDDFIAASAGRLQGRWHAPLSEPGPLLLPGQTAVSAMQTAMAALAALADTMPDLAVLPGVPAGQAGPSLAAQADAGRLRAGVGAALGGVALHGGGVPLVLQEADALDDMLPALCNAAAAGAHLVALFLEAGPPARHAARVAALRAVPNLALFRPADASETLECLETALRRSGGPGVLLLSRTPCVPLADRPSRTRSARGGYVAAEAAGPRHVTLIASGEELQVALQARALLAVRGIEAAVVSLPSWDLFAAQDAGWRAQVLGGAPRVGLEPGSGFGWARWLGPPGLFAGSEPAAVVADLVARHLERTEASKQSSFEKKNQRTSGLGRRVSGQRATAE